MTTIKHRKKMVVILLFLGLTSVCGLSMLKTSLHQVEEDENITIWLDSPNKMDLSFIYINCLFKSTPIKLLFEMIRGVENNKSQDQQFSGRVHCDREALKEGRIRIHIFGLKPEDSGDYECAMAANPVKQQWSFSSSVSFVINVTSKSGTLLATTKPEADNVEDKPGQTIAVYKRYLDKEADIAQWVIFGLIVTGLFFFVAASIILSFKKLRTRAPLET